MKKCLIMLALVVIVILPLAGCLGEIKTYNDSGQTIDIGVNQEFIIVLGSIPSTGYGWYEDYEKTMLELVDKTYQPGDQAKKDTVGAGGVSFFRFKALEMGTVKINMTYKRAWEEGIIDQKIFTINIH